MTSAKSTASYELHYEFKKPLNKIETFELYLEPAYDTETSEDIEKGIKWTIKVK